MTYKDPDKQREANRKAQAKFKAKGITNKLQSGITLPEKTDLGNTLTTTQTVGAVIPKRDKDFARLLVQTGADRCLGDIKPKRGKDIKCFADLPPDVPETIDMMSLVDDKIDKTIKVNRTAIAINYQHLFPGRFYPTGVA